MIPDSNAIAMEWPTINSAIPLNGASSMPFFPQFAHPTTAAPAPPKPIKTFAEVAGEFIALRKQRGANAYYIQSLTQSAGKISRFHPGAIDQLDGPTIGLFLESLGDVSPRTLNNYRAMMRSICLFARRRRYLPSDWMEPDEMEKQRIRSEPVGIYTPAEVQRILRACAPDILPVVALVLFAGVRQAEAQRMSWEDLDFGRRLVFVSAGKAKTGARRLCPMGDTLAAWLKKVARPSGKLWNEDRRQFEWQLHLTLKKALVKCKPNGLRHSFVSYRMAVLCDAQKVSLEAGNSPQMVFSNYREVVTPDAAKEFWSILPRPSEPSLKIARKTRMREGTPGAFYGDVLGVIAWDGAWHSISTKGGRLAIRRHRNRTCVTLELEDLLKLGTVPQDRQAVSYCSKLQVKLLRSLATPLGECEWNGTRYAASYQAGRLHFLDKTNGQAQRITLPELFALIHGRPSTSAVNN